VCSFIDFFSHNIGGCIIIWQSCWYFYIWFVLIELCTDHVYSWLGRLMVVHQTSDRKVTGLTLGWFTVW